MRNGRVLLAIFVVLAMLGLLPPPVVAAPRPIVFHGNSLMSPEIYRINPDGSGLRKLTSGGNSSLPRVSPDGRWIAYSRYAKGGGSLWRMRVDGSAKRRVSRLYDGQPIAASWSPDSKTILFSLSRKGIFRINRDGSGVRKVLGERYRWASWSPNGPLIVASRLTARDPYAMPQPTELVLVGLDGRIRRRLHRDDEYTNFAQWSPDGRQIMYWEQDNSTFNYSRQRLMNRDGSGNRVFVDTKQQDELAAWSPDGRQVAATANESAYGPVGLDVHDVATGRVKRIYRKWAYGVSW